MRRGLTPAIALTLAAPLSLTLAAPVAQAQVAPHRSISELVTSNGRSVAVVDADQRRVTRLLEHPYQARSDGSLTRDFAYDSYPGIRVGSAGTWLGDVEATSVGYLTGTGIIDVKQSHAGLDIDSYYFAPIELDEHVLVSLLRVERTGGSEPVDAYMLFNYHLGAGAPEPGSEGETLSWEAASDAWIEWGPSGAALGYGSIGPSTHHGSSPENPYDSLNAGQDLANNLGTGGAFDDAAAGLQWALGSPAIGDVTWQGCFVVIDSGGDVLPRVEAVRSWIAGRSPEQLLDDERNAWASWHTPEPDGLGALESELYQQQMAILRMGQVSEPAPADGQILASLPPGHWNIAWVRDMAYAVVALARSGHVDEARRALLFQLQAQSGQYQDYLGHPYQISITRYFGDGVEETDFNENGPNIEFDGFGLFLWTLHEYVEASGDQAFLEQWWPTVSEQVADTLVALQEPTGLIAADSSIWEVHWNGQQKHFAYTTITAANGLCRAASLAERLGDVDRSSEYLAAGRAAQQAIIDQLSAPDSIIAQSLEELRSGSGFLDAATIEAVGMGLVDPHGFTAHNTFGALEAELVPASGRGFFRNDDGGWYDSQEWVFVDLRTARAMRLAEREGASELLGWVTGQGIENFGLVSELHTADTADYAGEVPMVGFGAGAYSIAMLDRANPTTPMPCGDYAAEKDWPTPHGNDTVTPTPGADGGCGCRVGGGGRATSAWLLLLGLLAAFRRRAARSARH